MDISCRHMVRPFGGESGAQRLFGLIVPQGPACSLCGQQ